MMKKVLIVSLMVVCSSMAVAGEPNLEFETGYVVDGKSELQPSGLAVCDGKVIFVSDKHEGEIFQLAFGQDGVATAETWKDITELPEPPKQKYSWWMSIKRFLAELFGVSGGVDWEGITCDRQGNLYLASEYYFSVLKVDQAGGKEWLIDGLYKTGHDKGLFQKDNAYIEGISIDRDGVLLAVEREPRGFISVNKGAASVYVQPGPQISEEGLPYDYAGLDVYQGKNIVLERNHYKVCEFSKAFETRACYSFKNVAMSSDWGYHTGKYGLAEGLAIDGESLWIIVDNNGDARKSNPDDNRSTILRFKNPF